MNGSTVIPSLRYKDANAAIAWLVNTLGFTSGMTVPGPGNSVSHAELSWPGGSLMLGSTTDGSDDRLVVDSGPGWVYLVVDDVPALWERVLDSGADIVIPMDDKEHSGSEFTVRDPERNLWSIGSYRPGQ